MTAGRIIPALAMSSADRFWIQGVGFRELPLIVQMLVPVSCELCFRSLAIESAIAGLGRET